MNLQLLLAIFASIIMLALAFYAGILMSRIKRQQQQSAKLTADQTQQANLKKQQRNDNICESIRFIARATAQKQCNVSEASIRLSVLLETLLIEPKIDIDKNYPAMSALFDKVKDFSTHAERKSLNKKILKQEDKQRRIFEDEFEEDIIKEAQSLTDFSL